MASILAAILAVDPPAGGVSPLAWVIISALALALTVVVPALWHRGNKMYDMVYADLKACTESKATHEEDVVGVLKVLRIQMEKARGGKAR